MTDLDKNKITRLHLDGKSYGEISSLIGISINTIKSFFRRADLQVQAVDRNICPNCSGAITQVPNRKMKKFCCEKCRLNWWNKNRDKLSHKTAKVLTCAYCKANFTSYSSHKYCCHACYIADRFGDENE